MIGNILTFIMILIKAAFLILFAVSITIGGEARD